MDSTTRTDADVALPPPTSNRPRAAALLALTLLAAAALAMLLGDQADLMRKSAGAPKTGGDDELDTFGRVIDDLRDPLLWALWTVVPIGVIVGGCMIAIGSRKGMQVMASSAGAGLAVLLGLGLIA